MEARIARLTERERECLRLVGDTPRIKHIANQLGLTPAAVSERLRSARAKLDVRESAEAAALLRAYEANCTYTRYVDTPEAVADAGQVRPVESVPADSDAAGAEVREATAIYTPVYLKSPPRLRMPKPWRTKGAVQNDLTVSERIAFAIGLTAPIAVGAGTILAALVLALWLLIDLSRHGG